MTIDNLPEKEFEEVLLLIREARGRVFRNINQELIGLYWRIGEYISSKVEKEQWGKGVIKNLSKHIQTSLPDSSGFSPQNLWRMKQFYEEYRDNEKLSPLVRELTWTNNMIILSKTKNPEEREFYTRLAIQENYTKRELERQIDNSVYERSLLA